MGKKRPGVAQMLVQGFARDARLDHAIEIGVVHGEHAVHAGEIERETAERRVDVTFERGAGAERDDRHARFGAELDDIDDLVGRLGEQHGVGRLTGNPGERVGVLLAERKPGREARTETRGQFGKERGFAVRWPR